MGIKTGIGGILLSIQHRASVKLRRAMVGGPFDDNIFNLSLYFRQYVMEQYPVVVQDFETDTEVT